MMDDQDAPATKYDAALLRRLLRYLRPYRWLAAGRCCCSWSSRGSP